jgi:rare lipoprotein A
MRGHWIGWLVVLMLGACAAPRPQTTAPQPPCVQEGLASWYGPEAGIARTASGETLDHSALTAAHRSLPFGTELRVTNLDTGRSVSVRITDRGPLARDRIIDLSPAAATALEMRGEGVAHVRLEPNAPGDAACLFNRSVAS